MLRTDNQGAAQHDAYPGADIDALNTRGRTRWVAWITAVSADRKQVREQ